MTSPITTHVLDTAQGMPAAGVVVALERKSADVWTLVGSGTTDADGRLRSLAAPGSIGAGIHRLVFEVGAYFGARGVATFWHTVAIEFDVKDASAHYHVPLLVSPYAYSTYRGS